MPGGGLEGMVFEFITRARMWYLKWCTKKHTFIKQVTSPKIIIANTLRRSCRDLHAQLTTALVNFFSVYRNRFKQRKICMCNVSATSTPLQRGISERVLNYFLPTRGAETSQNYTQTMQQEQASWVLRVIPCRHGCRGVRLWFVVCCQTNNLISPDTCIVRGGFFERLLYGDILQV